ncbi:MAG: HEPN domain-containing protein [Candidatus Aminicenantes bacterium]|nr:HEPN domain-containing protein [Candidatus Aminicenantes bacterium]
METVSAAKRAMFWTEQAEEDFQTARIMIKSKRWKYAIFMCQQTLEKSLKAIYMEKKEEFPPRIHNLFRLSEQIGKELFPEDYLEFFSEISLYYIQSRYPEDIEKMAEINNKVKAQEVL